MMKHVDPSLVGRPTCSRDEVIFLFSYHLQYEFTDFFTHYVRKAHSRHARTKNGDARPGAYPISIHGRRATSERATYLISGWDPYTTNLRHALRVHISYF
jgi:hypothetical protein